MTKSYSPFILTLTNVILYKSQALSICCITYHTECKKLLISFGKGGRVLGNHESKRVTYAIKVVPVTNKTFKKM
jgi:hypothetical protein